MSRPRQTALSLDLDNLWSYLMVHGDATWKDHPSYLELAVPLMLELLSERDLQITFFIVGIDAEKLAHKEILASILERGHEIANHSHRHEPWLHRYDPSELKRELETAHEAISVATGVEPIGFRGPGYSISSTCVGLLEGMGYAYDASTLPTFIGPLARRYYFRTANLTDEQQKEREYLFGQARDGLKPIRPYRWKVADGSILEIPVTTFPLLRLPFHPSYFLYIAERSMSLARAYVKTSLAMCAITGVTPALLLHPLDFIGGDEIADLKFFPGMQTDGSTKRKRIGEYLDLIVDFGSVTSMKNYASTLAAGSLKELAAS
jgi:peptidoglycan-N-acetylglucosamine deacetylase